MTEAIIVSILTGIFTLTGTIITNIVGRSKIQNDLSMHNAVQDEKLDALTKQVEKHNNVIERVYRLEEDVKHLEQASHSHE